MSVTNTMNKQYCWQLFRNCEILSLASKKSMKILHDFALSLSGLYNAEVTYKVFIIILEHTWCIFSNKIFQYYFTNRCIYMRNTL